MNTNSLLNIYIYIYTHTHTPIYTHAPIYTNVYTHIYTNTCTHTDTHTCIHTSIHTQLHRDVQVNTNISSLSKWELFINVYVHALLVILSRLDCDVRQLRVNCIKSLSNSIYSKNSHPNDWPYTDWSLTVQLFAQTPICIYCANKKVV